MAELQEVSEFGGDPLLVLFARLVNNTDTEIHVTLTLSGAVLTGTLISRVKWMRLSARTMNAIDPGSGVIPEHFARILEADQRGDTSSEASGAADADAITYEYLHLKDAQYVSPSGAMPSAASEMLWRGRIAKVAGWSWGSLRES